MTESTRAAVYHCPFCAGEDLRPSDAASGAWLCRECARVFTVSMIEVDRHLIPGHRDASAATQQAPEGSG